MRVVVVDDFGPFRSFVCSALLQMLELEVVCEVSDGLAAVQKAEEFNPDLIVMDIGLPTLNGIEAARQIRKLVPKAKILFLSQESSNDVVQEVLNLGARGYVMKAHAGSELLAAVDAVLQGDIYVSGGLEGGPFTREADDCDVVGHEEAVATDGHSGSHEAEGAHSHQVQFYSDDEFFLERLSRFIAAALRAGKAAIVMATEPHHIGILEKLQADGVDMTAAIEQGRYVSLNVTEALSKFMVGDLPDSVRFFRCVGNAIAAAAKAAQCDPPRVVACGECAPQLLAEGKGEAAVFLERLTNELIERYDLDILCAYPVSSFRSGTNRHEFERICAAHSLVYQDGGAI